MARPLEELCAGDRVRVLGGKNFEKFHGGMEGTVVENCPDSRNMRVQFDDAGTSGPEPISVAYRNLEFAPSRGGYRAGGGGAPAPGPQGPPDAQGPPEAQGAGEPPGPLLEEHGGLYARQVVQLAGLQAAPELNGKLGRLRRFDPHAERWEVDVRGGAGVKRLKEANLRPAPRPEVPQGLAVAELKERGNECFKAAELEKAAAFYAAALELLEGDAPPPEAEDPKYVSVIYGNRAQCWIILCREVHGEEQQVGKEARSHAMRANMDAARAIELDPTNGKAYYRRGCAVLGMAPSASRAKEAIQCLETALTGRASGGKDGVVLPNAMRHEVSGLLDYAKRRLDACVEAAVPDVEQCRENCRQQ